MFAFSRRFHFLSSVASDLFVLVRVWRTLEFRDCALLADVFWSDRHCGSSDPGNGVGTRGV
jgi:hypothetical protein